ncbi:MAG: transglutaminase family protein [Pseudomonadales bacterium]
MSARIITASLICAFLALIVWWLEPASPEAGMARSLLGERWYRLSLEGRHLGYWHTRNYRDRDGSWVFESEQRFALGSTEPVTTSVRRVFQATPPHLLLAAEHQQSRRGSSRGVRIEGQEGGYVAVTVPADGSAPRPLTWRYALADYLAIELWLDALQPAAGARKAVDTLDFDRYARITRAFEVVARNADGYLIESAAPYAATRIELDERHVPRQLTISGLFDLTRTTRQDALAPRSVLQAASYHIPVDRRLAHHTSISRLVLGVHGAEDPRALFPDTRADARGWHLALTAPPAVGGSVQASQRQESLHFPSAHPRIAALASRAAQGAGTETDRALALMDFVHRFLDYQPGLPARGVLELLDDPRGDCTEFADLLTTLARSQGIPATTIFGLAYADGPQPAFAYHAWNELYVDGAWLAVDPTWGAPRVDATHIPLPDDEDAALTLLTGRLPLEFSIREVAHFPD